ncbi:unnamed protein product [Peniophora sp. CBMAI 1063]|nr:unnamed protein product [Peniophora sp. CBMAI 1063]
MSFSAFVLASSLLSGALAIPMKARSDFSAGAAYWLTNDPSGNAIMAADIASDGTLTLSSAYSMVGNGARGNTTFTGPDALFAQGVIQVHANANVLAAANAGSNTVSLFSIDPNAPTRLTAVGTPVSSGGHFPMSVAFNSAGDTLCALNSGEMAGVQCFNVSATAGLTPIASFRTMGGNYSQTTPPTGPEGTVSQIAFTPDDGRIAVAVKGSDSLGPGYVQTWDVLDDGSLSTNTTQILAPAGSMYPFSLTAVPGRNAFLAADFANGADVFDLDANTASLVNVSGQAATCWSAYSARTGNFYTSDTGTGNISEIALGNQDDGTAGSVVASYPFNATAGPIDVEVAGLTNADYLYILMPGAMAVGVMQLNGPASAQEMQVMDLVGPAQTVGINMSPAYIAGMAVYVKPVSS